MKYRFSEKRAIFVSVCIIRIRTPLKRKRDTSHELSYGHVSLQAGAPLSLRREVRVGERSGKESGAEARSHAQNVNPLAGYGRLLQSIIKV